MGFSGTCTWDGLLLLRDGGALGWSGSSSTGRGGGGTGGRGMSRRCRCHLARPHESAASRDCLRAALKINKNRLSSRKGKKES